MQSPSIHSHARMVDPLVNTLSHAGPQSAKHLCDTLRISQPTFSRVVAQARGSIVRMGKGIHTLYGACKVGRWGDPEIPLFIIDERGGLQRAATLHPIAPRGLYLESHTEMLATRFYDHLPYFFEDLRPSGFLGRLVPQLYPDLEFPKDITLWSDDDCLTYFTRCGWDLVGNVVIGEKSYDDYLTNRKKWMDIKDDDTRERDYPRMAEIVLSRGIPGSSAAGEQPKFLSIRHTPAGHVPVLVKFSPPIGDAISQRVADLLLCEHIAHDLLKKYGIIASHSFLVRGGDRLFLEIERFDRTLSGGRRGIVSLRALDLEFVGQLTSWSETAKELCRANIIDQHIYARIVWLDAFGKLIGNTDRHHGNISLFCSGESVTGLAPVYDMLPMMYAPQQNQLTARPFDPEPPKFFEIAIWNETLTAARDYWLRVQSHPEISEAFKQCVADNEAKLARRCLPESI